MIDTRERLIAEVHQATKLAEHADNAWQYALDRDGVDRYSLKARFDDRFNRLYLAKLAADVTMLDANEKLRRKGQSEVYQYLVDNYADKV